MIEIEFKSNSSETSCKKDDAVIYSKKIVSAIKDKVKSHNLNSSSKVYFYQIKDVYLSGAKELINNFTSNESGWARVNMYLRMLSEISSMAHAANEESKKTVVRKILDFSCLLKPIEQDFAQAKEDVVGLGVNFDFGDVSSLYLEDVENVQSYYQRFL